MTMVRLPRSAAGGYLRIIPVAAAVIPTCPQVGGVIMTQVPGATGKNCGAITTRGFNLS